MAGEAHRLCGNITPALCIWGDERDTLDNKSNGDPITGLHNKFFFFLFFFCWSCLAGSLNLNLPSNNFTIGFKLGIGATKDIRYITI